MEKGTVKSYDKSCGMGMIGRASDVDVRFYRESIIGRDRAGLMQGDSDQIFDSVTERVGLVNRHLIDTQKALREIYDVAKEKGYKMVLTFKKGDPTMLYGDPSLDITADVIKKLNEAYAKDKK